MDAYDDADVMMRSHAAFDIACGWFEARGWWTGVLVVPVKLNGKPGEPHVYFTITKQDVGYSQEVEGLDFDAAADSMLTALREGG